MIAGAALEFIGEFGDQQGGRIVHAVDRECLSGPVRMTLQVNQREKFVAQAFGLAADRCLLFRGNETILQFFRTHQFLSIQPAAELLMRQQIGVTAQRTGDADITVQSQTGMRFRQGGQISRRTEFALLIHGAEAVTLDFFLRSSLGGVRHGDLLFRRECCCRRTRCKHGIGHQFPFRRDRQRFDDDLIVPESDIHFGQTDQQCAAVQSPLFETIQFRTDRGQRFLFHARGGSFIGQTLDPDRAFQQFFQMRGAVFIDADPETQSGGRFLQTQAEFRGGLFRENGEHPAGQVEIFSAVRSDFIRL